MVRAELGSGDREAAMALLERLKTRSVDFDPGVVVLMAVFRGYPEAVYNRISGVMTDHSAIVF